MTKTDRVKLLIDYLSQLEYFKNEDNYQYPDKIRKTCKMIEQELDIDKLCIGDLEVNLIGVLEEDEEVEEVNKE